VKFDINPIQNNLKTIIHCEAPLVDKRIVKSGFREQRYVIKLVYIGDSNWPIEMTLTNRDLGFRMLLGRERERTCSVDPENNIYWVNQHLKA
jgi:ribosomal protein S6--L-glutamate ligase